jgi:flavin reductase (DIM6/NTAB) family NADH-FMN oxidoreductase RutF
MGVFPTGVTIVATRWADGSPCGLTVNSFTSVSLEPALVLVCIDHGSNTHDRLVESGSFAVSVLSVHQADLAARFALEPSETRFENLSWTEGPTGDPLVQGAAAWLACTLEAVHPGGDHSIMLGRVEELDLGDDDALAFYRGTFGRVER